jgi:hypothetical protein
MLTSYSNQSGTIIATIETASGGESSAAATADSTTAYRRLRARNCGVTSPSAARMTTTRGSSVMRPNAMMIWAANPK